jgi:hypothetical protein
MKSSADCAIFSSRVNSGFAGIADGKSKSDDIDDDSNRGDDE